MRYLIIIAIGLIGFQGNWSKGKVHTNGNLIIVELKNRDNCRQAAPNQIITVDLPWSILINYQEKGKGHFYIFNNEKSEIFKSADFESFIKELTKIPKATIIRKIDKCTLPFDLEMPELLTQKLEEVIQAKQCTLETKIMYCYCCAEEVNFQY